MFNKYTLAMSIMVAGVLFISSNSLEARHCGPRVSINFGALFCPPPPPCPVYQETRVYYPCGPRYVYREPVCYPCCPPPACEQVVIYNRPYYPHHYGW